jgi:hypothetical protein
LNGRAVGEEEADHRVRKESNGVQMQWEYEHIFSKAYPQGSNVADELDRTLSHFGEEAWELVAVQTVNPGQTGEMKLLFIFKRPNGAAKPSVDPRP